MTNVRVIRGVLPFLWAAIVLLCVVPLPIAHLAQSGEALWLVSQSFMKPGMLVAIALAYGLLTIVSVSVGAPSKAELLAGGIAFAVCATVTVLVIVLAVIATHSSWSTGAYLALAAMQVAAICASGLPALAFHAAYGEPAADPEPGEPA